MLKQVKTLEIIGNINKNYCFVYNMMKIFMAIIFEYDRIFS